MNTRVLYENFSLSVFIDIEQPNVVFIRSKDDEETVINVSGGDKNLIISLDICCKIENLGNRRDGNGDFKVERK